MQGCQKGIRPCKLDGGGEENLGVADLVDDAGRGEVEDAGATADGGKDGIVSEEVHAEEAETGVRSR